jgi:hypothetical protein
MTIRALRILPPLAIGRLGGADEPVASYTLVDDAENPLGFRQLVGQPTFVVDARSGAISSSYVPPHIDFKDGHNRIKPVAPFLEVFAETAPSVLEPLTIALLAKHGLTPSDIEWRGRFANRKVERRTGVKDDAVTAETPWFSNHASVSLDGTAKNFIRNASIPFGALRYIRPTAEHPEIRLRFTPAKGLIYGTNVPKGKEYDAYREGVAKAVYKFDGPWYNYQVSEANAVQETLPPSLYAIVPPAPPWLHDNVAVSRGYFDDACDGIVEVALTLKDGTRLEANARVTSGPPAIVPDTLFVRTLADDLDQALHGPEATALPDAEIHRRATDIIRRAHETVRFLNVTVMNGNTVKGRPPETIDTMPAEEAYDTDRMERPVMAEASVDTLAVMALHQQVYAALKAGTAPWFARFMRRPDEAADYSDEGRRKMPALMCGADNNYLALTWRQIDTISRAAAAPTFAPPLADSQPAEVEPPLGALRPRNLTAQLHYAAKGNPFSVRLDQSVANCTPGLEVDLRAVWRRIFEGIELREYDNLVVAIEGKDPKLKKLRGHRLLRVAGIPMMTVKRGPSPTGPDVKSVLSTELNPHAIQPLEWSNALAKVLDRHRGKLVKCEFSLEAVGETQAPLPRGPRDCITVSLRVRPVFAKGTAVISEELARPGELTQGLCSPWQNDYRECSCYYWASARPDYVNVEIGPDGASRGDNWLQKERTGEYVADDYADSRLILYSELFTDWENVLKFQLRGRDVPEPLDNK